MLGNYLTTALRLLWRERGYAAINIFGLAVGFALCLLIIQLADYQLALAIFTRKRPGLSRALEVIIRVRGSVAGRTGADPQGAIARS